MIERFGTTDILVANAGLQRDFVFAEVILSWGEATADSTTALAMAWREGPWFWR